jgi:hypothetical protein
VSFRCARILPVIVASAFVACSDPDAASTTVTWLDAPPATASAGAALRASFHVETGGEIHVAQLRMCRGDIPGCGVSGHDELVYAEGDGPDFTAELTLPEPGTYTVVAWVHVDRDPHLSDAVVVTAE